MNMGTEVFDRLAFESKNCRNGPAEELDTRWLCRLRVPDRVSGLPHVGKIPEIAV
jgi:hypothetical protein